MTTKLESIARRIHAGPGLDEALSLLKQAGEAVGLPLPAVIDDITGNTPSRDAEGRPLNERLGWPAWMIDGWYGRAYTRQHPIYLRCRFETRPFAVVHERIWAEAGALAHLTDRQVDCLYWLAGGKTIAETARILGISAHTVREHLRAVTARLGAVNTTHAVALACQFGIVAPLRQ